MGFIKAAVAGVVVCAVVFSVFAALVYWVSWVHSVFGASATGVLLVLFFPVSAAIGLVGFFAWLDVE